MSYTIFSVNTIFHLMISKLYIQNNNIKDAVIICYAINPIMPLIIKNDSDFTEKVIINRDQKVISKVHLGLEYKNNIRRVRSFLNKTKYKELIVFKDNDYLNQTLIDWTSNKGIKITLIEEGLGLYKIPNGGIKIKRQPALKRFLLSYPKYLYEVQGINPKVNRIIATRPNALQKEKLSNKEIAQSSFEDLSLDKIKEIYDYFEQNEGVNDQFKYHDKTKINILYIGQPLSEFKTLLEDEEKESLDNIFNTLIENNNVNVIIKPHPSEKIEKYKDYLKSKSVQIFEAQHIPAELIPSKVNIEFVLTGYSSACYYIYEWYKIKSYSLYSIFFKEYSNTDLKKKITSMYKMHIISELQGLAEICTSYTKGGDKIN